MLNITFEQAVVALSHKPNFKLLDYTGSRPSANSFTVKCLDCSRTFMRTYRWLESDTGCTCSVGAKISATRHKDLDIKFELKKARTVASSKPNLRVVSFDTAQKGCRYFKVSCRNCNISRFRTFKWLESKRNCLCLRGDKIRQNALVKIAKSKPTIREAVKALAHKPTFTVVNGTLDKGKESYFLVKCLDCGVIRHKSMSWIKSTKGCLCVRGDTIRASRRKQLVFSTATMLRKARAAIAHKPTFKVLKYTGYAPGKPSYKVKCLDCSKVELRTLGWIESKYGCVCTRVAKIAATQTMSKKAYSVKWNLSKRNIKIVSKFKGMHKDVNAKCLTCSHKWRVSPTNLRRSGCPLCSPTLMRARHLATHGVEYAAQRPDVIAKKKATMLARYGVEYALQDPRKFDKMVLNSYRTKKFQLNGKTVLLQGYEPQAIEWLLANTKIKECDLVCGVGVKRPAIPYISKSGHTCIYHPDIFIPRYNLIVEVKSRYTYNHALDKNLRKRAACEAQGFKFRFLVMNGDGSRCHV